MKTIYLKFRKRSLKDPEFVNLTALAGHIAQLLGTKAPVKQSLQACLDDLLGAVYSLVYANTTNLLAGRRHLASRTSGMF